MACPRIRRCPGPASRPRAANTIKHQTNSHLQKEHYTPFKKRSQLLYAKLDLPPLPPCITLNIRQHVDITHKHVCHISYPASHQPSGYHHILTAMTPNCGNNGDISQTATKITGSGQRANARCPL